MTDHLKLTKQASILTDWREEIDTCISRLQAAAGNATRAVDKWQEFASISDVAELAATGQSVAVELLGRESGSIGYLATLCQTFAAATGQTNAEIIAKLTTAIDAG